VGYLVSSFPVSLSYTVWACTDFALYRFGLFIFGLYRFGLYRFKCTVLGYTDLDVQIGPGIVSGHAARVSCLRPTYVLSTMSEENGTDRKVRTTD